MQKSAVTSSRAHWVEYAIEAAALGTFMVSAVVFTVLLEHPSSPLRSWLPNDVLRRALVGIAMGTTAIALIYSPPGRRSGAHMNPAVTLTFLRLGKVARRDAAGYVIAQFVGAVAALTVMTAVARAWLAAPSVDFVQTRPGSAGSLVAFAAEVAISLGMMLMVLSVSNSPRWAGSTGLCAGALVAIYITVEAPLSGTSMNPARSFAPSLIAWSFSTLWIYCTAPLAGMLAASELFVRRRGSHAVRCAKLHHDHRFPCIFHCTHPRPSVGEAQPIHAPALPADVAPAALPRPVAAHEECP